MSINPVPLSTQRVIDPRVDVNSGDHRTYNILQSAASITHKQFAAQTVSASTIIFSSIDPPSANILVNRKCYITATFRIQFKGTSAGAGIPLLQAAGLTAAPGVSAGNFNYDCPSWWPLASGSTSTQVSMNNDTISMNTNQWWHVMGRYHQTRGGNMLRDFSGTPSYPDQSLEHHDLEGFNLSPMSQYGDNTTTVPRGGFLNCVITRNDSTGVQGADEAEVLLTVREPLSISPWTFGKNEEAIGFLWLDKMSITINLGGRSSGQLGGLAGALWSHSRNGSVLDSMYAEPTSALASFAYMSPQITTQLPSAMVYSLASPDFRPSDVGRVIAVGESTSLQYSSQNLGSIPTKIYIWAEERSPDRDVHSTNTFLGITNVNMTLGNSPALLSNMDQWDLYQASVRNGCNLSWRAFQQDIGSVICLSFGTDIPLQPTQAPGLRQNINFGLTVQVYNQTSRAVNVTLGILLINEGTLTLSQGACVRSVGVLNQEEVLMSSGPTGVYEPVQNIYGGSIFRNIRRGISRAARNIGKAAKKYVRPGLDVLASTPLGLDPRFKAVNELSRSVGYGRSGGKRGRGLKGGQASKNADLLEALGGAGFDQYSDEEKEGWTEY